MCQEKFPLMMPVQEKTLVNEQVKKAMVSPLSLPSFAHQRPYEYCGAGMDGQIRLVGCGTHSHFLVAPL